MDDIKHMMTAEERAARYEMALRAIGAISLPHGDVRKIVNEALAVPVMVKPEDEKKPKWTGAGRY
jgi:hypothetical protein